MNRISSGTEWGVEVSMACGSCPGSHSSPGTLEKERRLLSYPSSTHTALPGNPNQQVCLGGLQRVALCQRLIQPRDGWAAPKAPRGVERWWRYLQSLKCPKGRMRPPWGTGQSPGPGRSDPGNIGPSHRQLSSPRASRAQGGDCRGQLHPLPPGSRSLLPVAPGRHSSLPGTSFKPGRLTGLG